LFSFVVGAVDSLEKIDQKYISILPNRCVIVICRRRVGRLPVIGQRVHCVLFMSTTPEIQFVIDAHGQRERVTVLNHLHTVE
jgi:hypothetical protein